MSFDTAHLATGAVADGVILALWHQKLDTLSIARHLRVRESEIYNRLLHIRDRDFRKTIGCGDAI